MAKDRSSLRDRQRSETGTLLLDTLTALAILAIIFAITYPNYIRALYEGQVATEAAQLEVLSVATQAYANDHHGIYPPATGYPNVSISLNGTAYITTLPLPAMENNLSTFNFSPNPDGGASYEILDGTPLGTYSSTYPASNITLLTGTYTRYDGTSCQSGDYFAIDNVHGVHCTQAGH